MEADRPAGKPLSRAEEVAAAGNAVQRLRKAERMSAAEDFMREIKLEKAAARSRRAANKKVK